MENKALIVGVIGPTNIQKFSKIMGKAQDFLLGRAQLIGEVLAKANCELWVNSDKGMLVAVARHTKMLTVKNVSCYIQTKVNHGRKNTPSPMSDMLMN